MSARVSHHPLVVNTADGSCWTRRAVTSDGRGLYALAGAAAGVPVEVLTSLAELAELGITGSAFALPVPVGRGEDGRPLLPMGAHWTDVPELVDQEVARIQGRVDQAQSGHWYVASDTETWRPPGTVCTRVNGVHRNVGRINVAADDLTLILHAHDDLSWCLGMIAKFRARVAELELERHTTNEALDDAVQALRADRAEPAKGPSAAESADKLTALFAPTQALRVEAKQPGACEACGSLPERWCRDCAACEKGCFGGFDGNECSHANAPWGGGR